MKRKKVHLEISKRQYSVSRCVWPRTNSCMALGVLAGTGVWVSVSLQHEPPEWVRAQESVVGCLACGKRIWVSGEFPPLHKESLSIARISDLAALSQDYSTVLQEPSKSCRNIVCVHDSLARNRKYDIFFW